jgi:hypothetical protein
MNEETKGEGKNLGGRPTAYKEEYNEQVYKLCLLGATDKEIGDFFGVTEQTINNWKITQPAFFESIKRGKVIADAEISESLYNRAKGFSKVRKVVKNVDGTPEQMEHEEYFPPDPTSMIYWLKNRRGRVDEAAGAQKWADKHEHLHGGAVPVRLVFGHDPQNEPINDSNPGGGDTGKTNSGI